MNNRFLLSFVLWLFSNISPLSAVSSNSIVQPPGQVVQSPQGDLPYQPYQDNSCRPNNDTYNRDSGYQQNHYRNHSYDRSNGYNR